MRYYHKKNNFLSFLAITLGLSSFMFPTVVNAQSEVVIKVTPFSKLPAVPYTEKSKQQVRQEEQVRTVVPIYNNNYLNYYSSKLYPLPLYGGWNIRPIHRYGCRTGDIVLVNAQGVERKFPIKTSRVSDDAKSWDKLTGIDCPFEATPKLVNSWISNSRYVVFETSDPGFVAFDFIKGQFVNNLVLKTSNISVKTALDGSIYFNSPKVSTVEQNRYFVDASGNKLIAPVDESIHRFAFAYREMYMCQEALSWGENCSYQDQLKKIFSRKN